MAQEKAPKNTRFGKQKHEDQRPAAFKGLRTFGAKPISCEFGGPLSSVAVHLGISPGLFKPPCLGKLAGPSPSAWPCSQRPLQSQHLLFNQYSSKIFSKQMHIVRGPMAFLGTHILASQPSSVASQGKDHT